MALQLAILLIGLRLLAVPQEPPAEKQASEGESPKPRLDLYGDPLPEGAVARMGTVRFRLPEECRSLSVSPDDKLLAIYTDMGSSIILMDADTGQDLGWLATGDSDPLPVFAFSADSKTLGVLGESGSIYLWDLTTRNVRKVDRDSAFKVEWGAFSPDLDQVAVWGGREDREGNLLLLDGSTGKEILEISGHDDSEIYLMAFSQDGKRLVTVGDGTTLRIWDLEMGKELRRIEIPRPPKDGEPEPYPIGFEVAAIALSPDGEMLAGTVELDRAHPNSPSGRTGETRHIVIADLATGKILRYWQPYPDGYFEALAISPDGKRLVAVGLRLSCWELPTGKEVYLREGCHGDRVAFLQDGERLAVLGHSIRLYDAQDGKKIPRYPGLDHWPRCLTFTPDCSGLVTADQGETIRIWDARSGRHHRKLGKDDEGASIDSLTVSQTGRYIVAVVDAYDEDGGTTRVWDCERARVVVEMKGVLNPVVFGHDWDPNESGPYPERLQRDPHGPSILAFSPDDRHLAIGTNGGAIRLWELASAKPLPSFPAHSDAVAALSFSDDGTQLTSVGKEWRLLVSAVPSGKAIRSVGLKVGDDLILAEFSPTGEWLACGDRKGRLHVWDLGTGEKHMEEKCCSSRLSLLQFSADGYHLLTRGTRIGKRMQENEKAIDSGRPPPYGDVNNLFRVWDVASGRDVMVLTGREGGADWDAADYREILTSKRPPDILPGLAALSPDGRTVATGGGPEALAIWEVATGRRVFSTGKNRGGWVSALAFSPDGRTVACDQENSALIWVTHTRGRTGAAPTDGEAQEDFEGLWQELAGGDVPRAYEAIGRLAKARDSAVLLLGGLLAPVPKDTPESVSRLIGNLDDDRYEVRESAFSDLDRLGAEIEPALWEALAAEPTAEARLRLDLLLDRLSPPFDEFPNDGLRRTRALQVLEMIGTDEAKNVLRTLATGSRHALQTREAKAALERLKAR